MKPVARFLVLGFASVCCGQSQQPNPQNATAAVLRAFDTHNIVMFGESHSVKQEYDWLLELVATAEFADRVDDIVMEIGNAFYQKSVDRYIAGEDIPLDQVQPAWRSPIGWIGPPSPVYESLYKAVREANLSRRGKHQMRILLGDPSADWDAIKTHDDLLPLLAKRDSWYAQVVKEEVLDKRRRALLIMGSLHFLREKGPAAVEQELLANGARPYCILFGTNATGGFDDLDKRFDAWPLPAVVELRGNWVGDLPAIPVIMGGTSAATSLKLRDAADAMLYVGPRDQLTSLTMTRAELEGTAFGKELDRRTTIEVGRASPAPAVAERPLFRRPPLPPVNVQLTLFDKKGKALQTVGTPGLYRRLSFSPPDAARVLATRSDQSPTGFWMFDLTRGLNRRFASDPADDFAVWSPDGRQVAFQSMRDGKYGVYKRQSNGDGKDELLWESAQIEVPLSWSGDGRFLMLGEGYADDGIGRVLPLDEKRQAFLFVRKGLGTYFRFSIETSGPPRWVAYESDHSGNSEIYLLPFDPKSPTGSPANAVEWQVSKAGGSGPRWSENGKALLYVAPDGTVVKADLTGNPKSPTGPATPMFKLKGVSGSVLDWDVSRDGKKFLFPVPVAAVTPATR